MMTESVGTGLVVYRLVDQRWNRINWEDQVSGDTILRIWYDEAGIENIQKYKVTAPPDMCKQGCPVLCDSETL